MSNKAHAPYNFVPLNDEHMLEGELFPHTCYAEGRHTGYFDVTLETKTPLFVRGMLPDGLFGADEKDERVKKAKSKPFVDANGKPVIPGSSLRGMIRAIVEIITFGKMHFVEDRSLIYRAVFGDDANVETYRKVMTPNINQDERYFEYPSSKVRAGYLIEENDKGAIKRYIQPAKTHGDCDYSFVLICKDTIETALNLNPIIPQNTQYLPQPRKIWVKPANKRNPVYKNTNGFFLDIAEICDVSDISLEPKEGYEEATIIFSNTLPPKKGTLPKRHWYPAIYEKNDDDNKRISISKEIWDAYVEVRDLKRGKNTEIRAIENTKKGEPLFYLVDDNDELIFFGHTMLFKIPYNQSIHDLMPKLPLYEELEDGNKVEYVKLDYADAIFGYVSEENHKRKPEAYSGRVSFTNARLKNENDDWDTGETLTYILSAPKPTTFQHYLEQPDITDVNNPDRKKLHHYGTSKARIRGHKFYWRKNATMDDLRRKSVTPSSQTSSMKAIKPNIKFCFRVYFENLTDAELGALAWALSLDDMPNGNRHHMLGMAKPYGLGVVKLAPTLYLSDRQTRYRTLFDANGTWAKTESKADYNDYIQKFCDELEAHGITFIKQARIREFITMLSHMADADNEEYQYMTIEPVNKYKDRPVLPRPRKVLKTIQGEQ